MVSCVPGDLRLYTLQIRLLHHVFYLTLPFAPWCLLLVAFHLLQVHLEIPSVRVCWWQSLRYYLLELSVVQSSLKKKNSLPGYITLDWQLFSFINLNVLLPSFLAPIFLDSSTDSVILFFFWVIRFKNFSFSLMLWNFSFVVQISFYLTLPEIWLSSEPAFNFIGTVNCFSIVCFITFLLFIISFLYFQLPFLRIKSSHKTFFGSIL
jgi:hypothetical protein